MKARYLADYLFMPVVDALGLKKIVLADVTGVAHESGHAELTVSLSGGVHLPFEAGKVMLQFWGKRINKDWKVVVGVALHMDIASLLKQVRSRLPSSCYGPIYPMPAGVCKQSRPEVVVRPLEMDVAEH